MSEMLVRVIDKPLSGNPALDSKRSMRGDVIVAKPDGWPWSEEEKSNPAWRIFKSDLSLTDAEAMRSSEPGNPKINPNLRRYLFKFDIDSMPAGIKTAITKIPKNIIINISATDLKSVKLQKFPWNDENII